MPSTSEVLHSLIFSSEIRHQRSFALRRRRSRELSPVGVSTDERGMVRDDRGADDVLSRPESVVALLLSEPVGCGVEDRENVLWKERRELEVVGRGADGESWAADWDAPESEVDEVAGERLLLLPISSGVSGTSRGLGASEGF